MIKIKVRIQIIKAMEEAKEHNTKMAIIKKTIIKEMDVEEAIIKMNKIIDKFKKFRKLLTT